MAFVLAHELKPHGGTAVALTPGWLRSEMMLDGLGVTEDNWRDALTEVPHLGGGCVGYGFAVAFFFVWRGTLLSSSRLSVHRGAGQRARISHKQVSSVEDAWKRTEQTQQVFLALVAAASSQQTDDEVPSEAELADWLSPCLN